TPYALCGTGKHWSSQIPNGGPCQMCAMENDSHVCCSGRHHYQNVNAALASACCQAFEVDLPVLLKEKEYREDLLAALEEPIQAQESKIQKFRDLKQSLAGKLAADRAARSAGLSRGEEIPFDVTIIKVPEDIAMLDGHIEQENAVLLGLTDK